MTTIERAGRECCGQPVVPVRYLKSGNIAYVCHVFLERHPEEFGAPTVKQDLRVADAIRGEEETHGQ